MLNIGCQVFLDIYKGSGKTKKCNFGHTEFFDQHQSDSTLSLPAWPDWSHWSLLAR